MCRELSEGSYRRPLALHSARSFRCESAGTVSPVRLREFRIATTDGELISSRKSGKEVRIGEEVREVERRKTVRRECVRSVRAFNPRELARPTPHADRAKREGESAREKERGRDRLRTYEKVESRVSSSSLVSLLPNNLATTSSPRVPSLHPSREGETELRNYDETIARTITRTRKSLEI